MKHFNPRAGNGFKAAVALNYAGRGILGVKNEDAAAVIVAELQKAFTTFKAENNKAVEDIRKGLADTVQADKVDRINATITELEKALNTVTSQVSALKVGGAGKDADPNVKAHSDAFNRYFRKGDREAENNLHDLEIKAALRTDSNPDGGFIVPEEMSNTIERVATMTSAMRQVASVLKIGTGTYKKLVSLGGAGSGWVGETDPRPETNTPRLTPLEFTVGEIYANPAATQTLLDDASIDIGAWLASEVEQEFSEREGAAFIVGDGVNKPRGLLAYDAVANGSYAWGKLGYVPSGVAGAISDGSNNGTDAMLNLYYALKPAYRNGASWLMSDASMLAARKLKNVDGDYLFAPPTAAAEVATILGKPVYNDDNMQGIGANAFPIAFGNFKRGYLILDRMGIRVLRDPFTNKPYVHFYTTKRVGGGVQNFEAIKLMKIATS